MKTDGEILPGDLVMLTLNNEGGVNRDIQRDYGVGIVVFSQDPLIYRPNMGDVSVLWSGVLTWSTHRITEEFSDSLVFLSAGTR